MNTINKTIEPGNVITFGVVKIGQMFRCSLLGPKIKLNEDEYVNLGNSEVSDFILNTTLCVLLDGNLEYWDVKG